MKTKRAYRYRFYPTPEQETLLVRTFVRFVYNRVLRWRTDEFHKNGNSVSYTDASRQLTALKKDPELQWLNDVSSVPIQQTLRHQQEAFKNFWAGRTKYPTFKKKHRKQSATFASSAFKMKDGLLFIAKSLAKKKKGSRNRAKARLKVARIHAKIADCRMDATHKATRTLINENQVVCVESLNVKGMIKNPKLAKHIADANWGEFVRQLKYKSDCTRGHKGWSYSG